LRGCHELWKEALMMGIVAVALKFSKEVALKRWTVKMFLQKFLGSHPDP
jgi:hypothetical protein